MIHIYIKQNIHKRQTQLGNFYLSFRVTLFWKCPWTFFLKPFTLNFYVHFFFFFFVNSWWAGVTICGVVIEEIALIYTWLYEDHRKCPSPNPWPTKIPFTFRPPPLSQIDLSHQISNRQVGILHVWWRRRWWPGCSGLPRHFLRVTQESWFCWDLVWTALRISQYTERYPSTLVHGRRSALPGNTAVSAQKEEKRQSNILSVKFFMLEKDRHRDSPSIEQTQTKGRQERNRVTIMNEWMVN